MQCPDNTPKRYYKILIIKAYDNIVRSLSVEMDYIYVR